ncbi:MAG: hypothetical protein FWD15_02015 [Alphaproteobacteria bacterium]|nr:hypothetical protein [Alphaproteobacteria bacterium]
MKRGFAFFSSLASYTRSAAPTQGRVYNTLAALLGVACLLFAPSAQAFDLYRVERVSVQAEGATGSAAKTRALNSARANAFNIVVARVLPQSDYVKFMENFNTGDTAKFVSSYRILSERTSPTSYSAEVQVVINRQALTQFMKSQGFEPLQTRPAAIEVIADFDEFHRLQEAARADPFNILEFIRTPTGMTIGGDPAEFITRMNEMVKTYAPGGTDILLEVGITSLTDFLEKQTRLAAIAGVKNSVVSTLSTRYAVFAVDFAGDSASLSTALRKAGFRDVQFDGARIWAR